MNLDQPAVYYLGGAVVGIPVYLAISFCLAHICRKAGTEPGLIIWLPVVRLLPLMRIAGMPFWMLFMLFLPCAQLIFVVMMWIGVTRARGKSMAWGFLAAFPCTAVVAIPYLAFSE